MAVLCVITAFYNNELLENGHLRRMEDWRTKVCDHDSFHIKVENGVRYLLCSDCCILF